MPTRTSFRTPIPSATYAKGDYVWVRWGTNKQQLARILTHFTSGRESYVVTKYRSNSKRWTAPLHYYPHEILGLASDKAVARVTPPRS